ncbi:MAG: alpha/beta hydrolase [Pseudomonadota bacterium]
MQRETIILGHRERGMTAQVWRGGSGTPVLLLHGAWAGARAHWSPVWDALAQRHTVIAPELPGFFEGSGERKSSYADYADWVAEVLDTLQCGPALVVGNSFGACIAWYLALRHAARCRALVLADGGPPPPMPHALRWVLAHSMLLQRLVRAQMVRRVFGREALATGFADAQRAPDAVRYALGSPDQGLVAHLLRVYLRSAVPQALPQQPALVVWGAQDRLPQCDVSAGRQLHERLPGSRLAVIEQAGHLPQVEQPAAFLQALEPLLVGH